MCLECEMTLLPPYDFAAPRARHIDSDWLLLALGYAVTPWALLELGTPLPTALAVTAHQAGWLPPA